MPLVEENRALAALALRGLPNSGISGLRALLVESGHGLQDGPVHEETVQFQLAPRINALGRFGSAMPAIELLTLPEDGASTSARAAEIAAGISATNLERRSAERAIVEEATARAEAEEQTAADHPVIVLGGPELEARTGRTGRGQARRSIRATGGPLRGLRGRHRQGIGPEHSRLFHP